MRELEKKIKEIENEISLLPRGYISKKIINGKECYYRQWAYKGTTKSEYIKSDNLSDLKDQIQLRKDKEKLLKSLKEQLEELTPNLNNKNLRMDIKFGEDLKNLCEKINKYQKRDCFNTISDFVNAEASSSVLLLYGLRRTGKTTLLFQSILSLTDEQFSKAVYIKAQVNNTLRDLNHDLKIFEKEKIQYIFIDEITLLKDFIDGAALLSDMYAPSGIKFILSGTDSLGLWLSSHEELYDRNIMIHTTFIPFREHSRLLAITDIDDYIEYGGTLKAGSWDFDSPELNVRDATFRNDESTRFYIDTAISKNILLLTMKVETILGIC